MENQRLGQSDRGWKQKLRARRLIGLTLACHLMVGVSSCSAPVESNEQTAAVEQKIIGPDGHELYGAKGAVDFVYTLVGPRGPSVSCTGSMIAPHVILTAARCFLVYSDDAAHDGEIDVSIHYYDPKSGRRPVYEGTAHWTAHPSFPGYTCDGPCLPEVFSVANWAKKNDPKHGRRRVHPGPPLWLRLPRFPGEIVDPFIADEADTAKNDLAVIVVPQELGSQESWPTDYHDYLRVFSDAADPHLDASLNAFGAGLYEYGEAYSDDKLRYANFDTSVENNDSPGPDFLRLEGRQNDDRVNMCRGDNGGPVEYSVTVEGQSVPTVAAVWSGFNMGIDIHDFDPLTVTIESPYCANNNHADDDSYACIVNDAHVLWLEGATGLSCVDQTGGNVGYKRCFDLPMVEDAPGEGLYAANVATAIVMSAL
ncbi:MAG TPA: hypothetical protein VJV79_10510 [Polyangiaceae bacterium]|nr:hypothetical protein [Polyangiaceae bacterium]